MIAERRECSIKATSITINNHELEDDKTPTDMQLNPDMVTSSKFADQFRLKVHTIDVITVGINDNDLPTFKCIQKEERPILIQVEKVIF